MLGAQEKSPCFTGKQGPLGGCFKRLETVKDLSLAEQASVSVELQAVSCRVNRLMYQTANPHGY